MELHDPVGRPLSHTTFFVDFNNASHVHLLDRAWDELFIKKFPCVTQQETVADWKRRTQDPDVHVSIPMIVENPEDPDNTTIFGMAVGTFFRRSQTLLQDYTVANDIFEKQGIGTELMLKREFASVAANNGNPLKGRFAEIEDPNKFEGEVREYAERRSKGFLGKGNAMVVPIDYTQPSLSGFAKDDDLVLLSYRLDNGEFATPHSTESMLVDMYEHYGIFPPADIDLVRMRGELRQVYPERHVA